MFHSGMTLPTVDSHLGDAKAHGHAEVDGASNGCDLDALG